MHIIKVMMTHSSVCARVCIPVLLSNSRQQGWYKFTNNGVLKKAAFLWCPVCHALNHGKILLKFLWWNSFWSTRELSDTWALNILLSSASMGWIMKNNDRLKHVFTHPHCLNGGYLLLLFNQLYYLKNVEASSLDLASFKIHICIEQ